MDVDSIRDRVFAAVVDQAPVVAAYLFGSAVGSCRPDSDLDIGLFLTGIDPSSREAGRIAGEVALRLTPLGGHPFDVNIVDPAQTIFAYRVISQGVPLVVRDDRPMRALLEKISRDYADAGYYYRRAVQEILEGATSHDT